MGAAFEEMFASPEVNTDPETVVGPMNDAVEPMYEQLLEAMGMAEVATIKPKS